MTRQTLIDDSRSNVIAAAYAWVNRDSTVTRRSLERAVTANVAAHAGSEAPPTATDPLPAADPMTKRQAQLLAVIEASIVEHSYPPTLREMIVSMEPHYGRRVQVTAIRDHLVVLERKGYITRGRAARSIKLTRPVAIPVAVVEAGLAARLGCEAAPLSVLLDRVEALAQAGRLSLPVPDL